MELLYKGKNAVVTGACGGMGLEISKNLDDPTKMKNMIDMLDERKKEPVDYRRTGVITLFTGLGLFLFGVFYSGF